MKISPSTRSCKRRIRATARYREERQRESIVALAAYQICGPNAFNRYGFDEQLRMCTYLYNGRYRQPQYRKHQSHLDQGGS